MINKYPVLLIILLQNCKNNPQKPDHALSIGKMSLQSENTGEVLLLIIISIFRTECRGSEGDTGETLM